MVVGFENQLIRMEDILTFPGGGQFDAIRKRIELLGICCEVSFWSACGAVVGEVEVDEISDLIICSGLSGISTSPSFPIRPRLL